MLMAKEKLKHLAKQASIWPSDCHPDVLYLSLFIPEYNNWKLAKRCKSIRLSDPEIKYLSCEMHQECFIIHSAVTHSFSAHISFRNRHQSWTSNAKKAFGEEELGVYILCQSNRSHPNFHSLVHRINRSFSGLLSWMWWSYPEDIHAIHKPGEERVHLASWANVWSRNLNPFERGLNLYKGNLWLWDWRSFCISGSCPLSSSSCHLKEMT